MLKFLHRLPDVLDPDMIKSDPLYLESLKFKNDWKPDESRLKNYDWIKEYAVSSHSRCLETYKYLDDKADSIIRYVGGLSGLLTLGALAGRAGAIDIPRWLFAVPAIFAILTILLALAARLPSWSRDTPNIKSAIDYAESDLPTPEITFLAQWHATCVALQIATRRKAQWVVNATASLGLTLFVLLLCTIAATFITNRG
jgi:hypothetical protein